MPGDRRWSRAELLALAGLLVAALQLVISRVC